MIVGRKSGLMHAYLRSVKDVANSIYDYSSSGVIKCLRRLIGKQKNVDLQQMTSYLDSEYLITAVTSGVINIIDYQEDRIHYSFIAHSGNITGLEVFLHGSKLMTSSGSFNQNHDNSLNIFKVSYLMDNLYIKKQSSLEDAHGKLKGVIVAKTVVHKGHELIFSGGGSDDKRVRIWDSDSGYCLFECLFSEPIYGLNFLAFSENEEMTYLNEDVLLTEAAHLRLHRGAQDASGDSHFVPVQKGPAPRQVQPQKDLQDRRPRAEPAPGLPAHELGLHFPEGPEERAERAFLPEYQRTLGLQGLACAARAQGPHCPEVRQQGNEEEHAQPAQVETVFEPELRNIQQRWG